MIQKYTHDGSRLLQQIGMKGVFDTSDGTTKGTPLNSNAARFTSPASIQVDRQPQLIQRTQLRLGNGSARRHLDGTDRRWRDRDSRRRRWTAAAAPTLIRCLLPFFAPLFARRPPRGMGVSLIFLIF
jgi:hypothetical protein